MLTHNEYVKRRDEILTALENHVAADVTRRIVAQTSATSPRARHLEAVKAIDQLFLEMVGEDERPDLAHTEENISAFRKASTKNMLRSDLRTIIKGGA